MAGVRKIVLCGPESCGKSFVGEELSKQLEVAYIPEYARVFLEKHGAKYDKNLLESLWKKHLIFQKEGQKKPEKVILLDTDLLNYKIWFQEVFDFVPSDLLEAIEKECDHRYLLFYPDIPWKPDKLRENPSNRVHLFNRWKEELDARRRPYKVVKGNGENRVANAQAALKELID